MDQLEEVKYNITNHAMERYAERIAGKTDATNIRIYINEHRESINERINKLINYGELIFEGKIRDYSSSKVYYKDHWVIIVDPKNNNVVTLYKIDLGDEEVNDLFVKKTLEKIKAEQKFLIKVEEDTTNQIKEYKQVIDDNINEIEYSRKVIKSLEEVNESYKTLIKNANLNVEKQKKKITDLVDVLIARKQF